MNLMIFLAVNPGSLGLRLVFGLTSLTISSNIWASSGSGASEYR